MTTSVLVTDKIKEAAKSRSFWPPTCNELVSSVFRICDRIYQIGDVWPGIF